MTRPTLDLDNPGEAEPAVEQAPEPHAWPGPALIEGGWPHDVCFHCQTSKQSVKNRGNEPTYGDCRGSR
jgi:hypothetical protein